VLYLLQQFYPRLARLSLSWVRIILITYS
jgi:hypothetical protein